MSRWKIVRLVCFMTAAMWLLSGCVSGMDALSSNQNLIQSLAQDRNTAAICLGAIPPYFGGFSWVREAPEGKQNVKCPAEITTPASSADIATAVVQVLIAAGVIKPGTVTVASPAPVSVAPVAKPQ